MAIDNEALESAARRVGDRWTLRMIGALLDGERTFSELGAEIEGIAPNILAARLRTLEAEGLIAARQYASRPPRRRYALTAPGHRLAAAIDALAAWGARRDGSSGGPHHQVCGTALVSRTWCPTCERPVDGPEAEDVIWA